jgi:GntR family transcriptional regulator
MTLREQSLKRDIPIPLYYQLKEILLEVIKESEVGTVIPPEMELCSRYNISRPTVRQALNELVVEGYLQRHKGRGTFVSRPKINQDFLLILESFDDEMQKKGLRPETEVLEFEKAESDRRIREKLALSDHEPVIKLRRLRSVDGEPMVLVLTYLPYSLFPGLLDRDMRAASLYGTLEEEYDCTLSRSTRTLESRLAGEYEARILGISKGAPVQYIETTAYRDDGRPVEFSIAQYRGDRNSFTFELSKRR